MAWAKGAFEALGSWIDGLLQGSAFDFSWLNELFQKIGAIFG